MKEYRLSNEGSEIQELLNKIKNMDIYEEATTEKAGLMSAQDKVTLNTLNDNVGENIQQINELNSTVSQNSAAIETNAGNIATNTSSIGTLNTVAGGLDTRLSAAEETLANIFQLDANNFMGIYSDSQALEEIQMTGAGWALVGEDLTELYAYVWNNPEEEWQKYGETTYDYSDYSGLVTQLATIGSKLGDLTELETEDKTDLVSAINEVKEAVGEQSSSYGQYATYNQTSMESGYYTLTVGSVPSAHATSTYYRMKLAVIEGDKFTLAIKGGSSARAWAFTDSSLIVQDPCAVANLDTTTNPVELTAPCDGWLYLNSTAADVAAFSLIHYRDRFKMFEETLEDVEENVENSLGGLQSQITVNRNDLDKLLRKTSYPFSDLTEEGYYNFNGKTIGSSAPNFQAFTNYYSARFNVKKGDRITIASKTATGSSRIYALTDSDNIITVLAANGEDTLATPAVIEVTEDSTLIVCCKGDYQSQFSLVIEEFGYVLESDVQQMLWDMDASVPKYRNNPLPLWKDTLRVLAVGNSYTDDSLSYIPYIAAASGIDLSKICIVKCWQSASSLEAWASNYDNDASVTVVKMAGTLETAVNSHFKTLLESADWDVITFQEVSTRSLTTATFEPYLTHLMAGVRKSCPNKKVAIGWNLIWRYKNGFNTLVPQGEDRWKALVQVAMKKAVSDNGLNIVIPSGTAIENARNTSLNDAEELTRDGTHLSDIGRYIVGCAWWEALVAPMFNNTILGNTSDITDMPSDSRQTPEQTLTAEQKALAQQCAFNSVIDMWNLTLISE